MRFGIRKGGGRLIQNQQTGLQGKSPGQHHQLAFRLTEVFNRLLQWQIQPQSGSDYRGTLQHAFAPQPKPGTGLAQLIQQQVFRHAQTRRNRVIDVLMHRHNPDLTRRQRRIETLQLPVNQQLARIMGLAAGEDLHQRRFARAIGTQQRHDFGGVNLQVHTIQGTVGPERFTQTAHTNQRIRRHSGRRVHKKYRNRSR